MSTIELPAVRRSSPDILSRFHPGAKPTTSFLDRTRGSLSNYKPERVCFEHAGFAHQKAVAKTRTSTLGSVPGERCERIVEDELGPLPAPITSEVLEACEVMKDIPY